MKTVIIDKDPSLRHEMNSPLKRAVNSVLIPTLNSLPTSIRKYLKKSHKAGKEIIEHATTHKALDILYGHGSAKAKGNVVQNFFNSIWLSTNNAKAVRNRLKLVKREVREEIVRLANEGKEIRIASIASGSARAITESIVEASLGKDGISRLSATFVDKNPAAIEYSRKLAENLDFKDRLNWINDTAGSFFRSNVKNNRKFDIIEIVGLIDYFDDEKAITMFSMIYESLERGGMMITANISDNQEREFIDRVLGWHMIYRSAEELASVVLKSGFREENTRVMYEPQNIHCVVATRK